MPEEKKTGEKSEGKDVRWEERREEKRRKEETGKRKLERGDGGEKGPDHQARKSVNDHQGRLYGFKRFL